MADKTPTQKDAIRYKSRQQKLRATHRALGLDDVRAKHRNATLLADIARSNYLAARSRQDPDLGGIAVRAMEAIREAEYWDEVLNAFLEIAWKQESRSRSEKRRQRMADS